ncbi:Putative Zinc finger, TFIIS-type, transcription elongation factor S-II, central [Septoria linicola]|uniref:Transcription elongation factor n=1 Tax=Septoria linicola TaxID=215465 RepID=A0A9Q9AY35_9PEZI|nr:Putative Zinc finger, TFIIS-type, transcription elongation factor S-II, central [Septoria linicola]
MDAKELHQVGKQVLKAVETGDPASTVLELLKPLENFRATEDLLRQSKIGVIITKLRQNKDPKVAETASKLVNRWKQEVNAKKKKAGSDSPAPSGKNGVAAGSSAAGSPAPQVKSEVKSERKSNVDPSKRTTLTDKVDHNVTGDVARDGCLKLMYDGIAFMSEESPDAVLNVARKVEVAAFEHFKQETNAAYKQKMRSLFQNLKFKDNQLLRRDVFTQKIEPKRFVTMTSEELKSEDRRKEDEALEKENMSKAMTAQEAKAISTTMTCGRCKESKVSYSQAQTRSADEPLTTFCECTVCGHRWKCGSTLPDRSQRDTDTPQTELAIYYTPGVGTSNTAPSSCDARDARQSGGLSSFPRAPQYQLRAGDGPNALCL